MKLKISIFTKSDVVAYFTIFEFNDMIGNQCCRRDNEPE
jgi:hypothetical protein